MPRPNLNDSAPLAIRRLRAHTRERMHRHRERQKLGLRYVGIEIRDSEIKEMVRRGFLAADAGDDEAIREAVYALFDETLDAE